MSIFKLFLSLIGVILLCFFREHPTDHSLIKWLYDQRLLRKYPHMPIKRYFDNMDLQINNFYICKVAHVTIDDRTYTLIGVSRSWYYPT